VQCKRQHGIDIVPTYLGSLTQSGVRHGGAQGREIRS
jgi:hypothetical protein